MPISNGWIIRALAVRLRQPGMRPQRRFMFAVSLLMILFATGAVIYLFRQPTEDAMERAAIKVFALMGILIAIVIAAAVVVRKRTRASWSQAETLQMTGERREVQPPPLKNR
jgi:cytochrome bd-type quinol oxidase subunit 1